MNIGGKKVKGWYVVAAVAGIGVVVYEYRKSAGASSASSASSSTIDPTTGLPASMDNQIDPATGLTYLAEAQQYGSVSAAEAAVTGNYYGSGSGGYGGTAGGPTGYGYSYGGGTTNTQGATSYSTNAQWAQAVTSGLTSLGYSATDVAAALGLYFQDMPLGTLSDGASALSIVQAAVAEFGPPPVGTFTIKGPAPGPHPLPVEPGIPPAGKSRISGTVAGLRVTAVTSTGATLEWKPTKDATSYDLRFAQPARTSIMSTNATSYQLSGLKPKTHYEVYVTAEPSSSGHAAVSFTTT